MAQKAGFSGVTWHKSRRGGFSIVKKGNLPGRSRGGKLPGFGEAIMGVTTSRMRGGLFSK